jgi:hypothetical protein
MQKQTRIIIGNRQLQWAVVFLLLAAYLGGYAYSRHQRLSLKHAAKQMIFTSREQGEHWLADFEANRRSRPLDYSDSEFLYILFWPAIRVDSLVSGRHSLSPFANRPYAIPHEQGNAQHPPVPEQLSSALTQDQVTKLATDFKTEWLKQNPSETKLTGAPTVREVKATSTGWHIMFGWVTLPGEPEGESKHTLHIYLDSKGKLQKIVRGPDEIS